MATHHNTPVLYNGYGAGYRALREMPISINPDFYEISAIQAYEKESQFENFICTHTIG